MMLKPPESRRAPVSPQLAMRVAVLGGVALALFAIVFFRLWFLQVLSGDKYLAQANDNRVRDVVVAAPRGDIVDRSGKVLVDNRIAIAAQIQPQELPADPAQREGLYRRLGRVLGMSPRRIERTVDEQKTLLPYANITIKADVSPDVYAYLVERGFEFPSVTVNRVYLRSYPYHELGAQLLGTVGQLSPSDERNPRFRGVKGGTVIGKDGLEYTYDRYLRGKPGATRVQVDALGRPKGELALTEPVKGQQLKLSIDLALQKAGQQAMSEAGGIPITDGVKNRGGAFVAMDPRNGEILAMGSYPTYDPNLFAKPIRPSVFKKLNSEDAGSPLINRAIQAVYPTGSTFKLVTGIAGLQEGVITPTTPVDDPGSIRIGNITFKNAGNQANGVVDMRSALKVSSDVYFYRLGRDLDALKGQPLQSWAKRLGFGKPTGIDLPGETGGLVPNPAWRNDLYAKKLTDRPWSVGDNVNLSVGQGDLQATPLQLATAYATLENGGRVVTPHVGLEVEDSSGRVLQRIEPGASRKVVISASTRQAIADGLRAAASQDGGTSADVFRGFPYPVHGKTGTAERAGQADQSWYVAYVPDKARPIVVAATVEQGGFGAEAAAPAVRLILSQWFGVQKRLIRGNSATR